MSVVEVAPNLHRSVFTEIALSRKGEFANWSVKNGESYDESFRGFIGKNGLPRLVDELRKKSGTAYVLDLMGYGHVLRRFNVDAGLAVALDDLRRYKDKREDKSKNIHFIKGNVMREKTWKEMERWLEDQGGEGTKFNLILCRPLGGLRGIPPDRAVHAVLLQRAWRLLNDNCGTLLTQIPHPDYDRNIAPSSYPKEPEMREWVKRLNFQPGIRTRIDYKKPRSCLPRYFRPALLLVKNPGAPERLPFVA